MNKIYKLVWSKVRNTWVVTSEIAKGHGKDSSSERNGKRLKLAVMTAILGGCFMTAGMSPVAAALTPEQQAVYDAVMAQLKASGKVELGGKTGTNTGVAIGSLSEAPNQGTVAIGESAKGEFQSVAIGQDAQARWVDDTPNVSGNNIAIGASTRAYAANGIAQGNYASVYGTRGIAIGLQATVGEKPLTEQEYQEKVASGEISAADKKLYVRSEESNGNFVYRKLDTTGTDITKDHFNGIAIGSLAQSNAADSIALGSGAETYGDSSWATGYKAKAEGDYSMALGVQANSKKRLSVAIGGLANASEANAVALGARTQAKTSGGVAIGAASVADREAGAIGYALGGDNSTIEKALESAGLKDEYDRLNGITEPLQSEYNGLVRDYQTAARGSSEKAQAAQKLQEFAQKHAAFMTAVEQKAKMIAAWKSASGAVSIGDQENGKTRQLTGLAAGTQDTDAVNVAQLKAVNQKVDDNKIHYLSIGPDNEKNLAQGGNYNNDGVEQHWGIAIGVDASSKDGDGIALGATSRARGYSSIGLGSLSSAVGDYSTATGHQSQAFGDSASAFGALARAYGANGVAIGGGALVSNSKALTKAEYDALSEEEKALYHTEKTRQDEFYQYKQKTSSGAIKDIEVNGVAVGNYASSIGYGGVSVGNFAKSMGKGGVAIGDHAKASDKDNIQNSAWGVALGAYSQNKVQQGVAIGTLSVADRAKDKIGYVLGGDNSTLEKALESIGQKAKYDELTGKIDPLKDEYNGLLKAYQDAPAKSAEEKTAKQKLDAWEAAHPDFLPSVKEKQQMINAWQSGKGAVSVGSASATRQIINVAAGSEDTDAVNVAQLKVVNAKVDKNAADITTINDKITNLTTNTGSDIHYFSAVSDPADKTTSDGTNWKNDGAKGAGSMAIGRKASTDGEWNMAVGFDANAKGKKSTAIGAKSSANGEETLVVGAFAKAEGLHATAIGAQSNAKGMASNAFGQYSKAEGLGATAFGFRAAATSEGGLALGPNTQVTAKFGTAIGLGAIAMQEEGVALGTQSLANRAPMTPGYNPAGEQWSDFQDYLTKTGQKDAYDRANEKLQAAKQALAPFDENHRNTPEAREAFAKYMQAGKELNDIFSTWAGAKGAISIGNESAGMTRQLTGLAAGTKDTDAVNVAQLKALNTKVDQGAIHYYSVTSDKKAAGSNYDNDGAKAADSMVIGIGSSSEAPNSTVLGNNNTLKRYNADQNGSSSRNNIVVGQNMEVEGAHNAVFGTDYQNNRENRKTMVAGKYNTVIGVGNLAGYTAEKDPQDRFKWIYKKVQGGSDSGNVVVGMNNTATRGSIVIGAGSEASSLGTSVGSNNKVIGNGNGGLALGNSLTVDGEQAVAIGSESQAKADYAVAVGQEAIAEKESSIAFGNSAKAQNNYSVAFGSFATATARSGVALGSSSLADREKGEIGYLAENKETEEWKATKGAISIGNSEKKYTRQLTGLAAGTFDTDAVNVAQLKVVNKKADDNATKLSTVENNITNLKGGFTLKDANNGTANIALGETTKPAITFKAETENTEGATSALTATVDDQKNVTYKLNTKKLKEEMGLAQGVGSMSSWKLKAGNTASQAIVDGDEVEFAVETADKGLTVKREGKKIQYGIDSDKLIDNINNNTTKKITNVDGDNIDLSNNTSIKTINENITKLQKGSGVHYFSVKSTATGAGSNYDNDGATGENAIAIGREARAYGLDSSATGENAWSIGNYSQAWGYYALAGAEEGIDKAAYDALSDAEKKNYTLRELSIGGKDKSLYYRTTFKEYTNDEFNALTEQERKDLQTNKGYGYRSDKKVWTPTPRAIAVGHLSKALGAATVAVGNLAEATGPQSTAIGTQANASGGYSFAAGDRAKAQNTGTIAIGMKANASGEWSTVVGSFAEAGGKWGTALGLSSVAQSEKGVALGAASLADREKGTVGYLAENKETEEWKATLGAASVGNETKKYTRQLTGLAAGTKDTDAVNVAQLKVVNAKTDKNAEAITKLTNTVNANGKATIVKVDGEENKTDGNLTIKKTEKDGQLTYDLSLNDELTIGKDGKDGKIGINGKDGTSAEIRVGKGEAGVDGKDGITRIIYKDKDGKNHEVATLDDGLKFKGDNGDVVIRKLNTQLNIEGGAKADELSDNNIGVVGTAGDNGGMKVKLSKKLKGLTSAEFVDGDNITNITGGNVTITRKEGNTTNKVDLWELNKIVNNITAGTTDVSSWKLQANGENDRTIKKDSIVNFTNGTATKVTVKDNDVTVDLNDATKKQINDNTTNINNMKNDITDIKNTVNNIDTKIEQKIEGSKIKVEGDAKTGVKAEAVKTGDKVTGYKVSLEKKVQVGNVTIDGTGEGANKKGEITGLTNKDWDGENIVSGRAATEDQLQKAIGKVQKQSFTTVKGKGNITVTPETEGASKYTVELAKDISVDSVTAKEYKVGDKTYINDKGINANKNKITNVADGVVSKDSKDAVNGSQLFATNRQVLNNMNQINNLREESREGDALGAAMAALKPLDFDPYQRSQVMAGVGYYRGKEAVALGLAHYKNEDLMIHGGLAYAGNSELMANVGVSYRFGSSEDREAKQARNLRMPQYDKGPISSVYILQDEVDRLTKENKEANDRIAALEAKLEKVLEKVK